MNPDFLYVGGSLLGEIVGTFLRLVGGVAGAGPAADLEEDLKAALVGCAASSEACTPLGALPCGPCPGSSEAAAADSVM